MSDAAASETRDRRWRRLRRGGWRGWIDEDWVTRVEGDPLDWLHTHPHEMVGERPSARTTRVRTPHGTVYAKHITAPGDASVERSNAVATAKWLLRPSRALRVLRVSRRFERAQLRVPRVILAARRRRGWSAEDLVVTAAVDGESLQSRLVESGDESVRRNLLRLAGQRVAALHRSGLGHGDLLPGNLLVVDGDSDLVFIDNDRSRWWWPLLPAWARRRNLTQMLYRLIYWVGYHRTREFLASYYDSYGMSRDGCRAEITALLRSVRPRLHEAYGKHGRRGAWLHAQ